MSSLETSQKASPSESWVLAKLLSGRYGTLALTRAAAAAHDAKRRGDMDTFDLWLGVVADLRKSASYASLRSADSK